MSRPAHVQGRSISVEFRPTTTPLLAGGPVEVSATLRLLDGDAATVTTSVERSTGRSRDYRFAVDGPEGVSLGDPYAAAIEMGGVQTSDQLTVDAPLEDTVLLNQFLELERLRSTINDGDTAEVRVRGERVVHLVSDQGDDDTVTATAIFTLQLRRDDAALAAVLAQMAESICATPGNTTSRTRDLLQLSTIRDPIAQQALEMLASHPDPEVTTAAAQALAGLRG